MPYIADSDWIIHALGGHQPAIAALNLLPARQISFSAVTIGEVYEGAFGSSNPQARIAQFNRLLMVYRVITVDAAIMEQFAEIRSYLRRRGELIGDLDTIIGATALHYDLTVLTFNVRHLGRIPDIRLYMPSS